MPEWVLIVLGIIAVPLAAILGVIAVIGFGIWMGHKNRMAKLQVEEKERQAQLDRELLGLGSKDISAHLEVLLERMNAVEARLQRVEAAVGGAAPQSSRRIPIAGAEEAAGRQDRGQTELTN